MYKIIRRSLPYLSKPHVSTYPTLTYSVFYPYSFNLLLTKHFQNIDLPAHLLEDFSS